LKPIPKKEKPEEEKEEVKLKPIPKTEKPEEEKEEVKLKPVPKKEKPEEGKEEVKLKPISKKEKPEEEKEEVKLKPAPKREKPEEEKEEVKLKPIPNTEKPEEEKEEVKLKPVPKKEKPEEGKEEVKLKPFRKKEKPEEEKEEVKLKPTPRKDKPEEEKEQVKLTPELEKKKLKDEAVSKEKPKPIHLKDESKLEEEKSLEKTSVPWRRKETKEPQPKLASDVEKSEEIPQAVEVRDQVKPVDTPEEKTVAPWRRKNAVKPEDITLVPVPKESKPELKPIQVEDKVEEYREEKKSKTHVTFSTTQKQVSLRPKPELLSEENKEVEEVQETWQKEMRVDTVSKKKVTQEERTPVAEEEGRPLRELEIITAKRVTEGVICLPEEPVVEDVETCEERHTVRHSLLQETKMIPPYFMQRLQPVTAEPNKTAIFTCQVDGYPFPELMWYHNGVEIQLTSRTVFKVFKSTATLEICDVTPDDVGNYTCQASNSAGIATSTANLVVIGMCLCVACSSVHMIPLLLEGVSYLMEVWHAGNV
jgi:hypothetical protein